MRGLTYSNPDFACGCEESFCELTDAMNNHNDTADAVLIENTPIVRTQRKWLSNSKSTVRNALARQCTLRPCAYYLSFHSMPLGSDAMPPMVRNDGTCNPSARIMSDWSMYILSEEGNCLTIQGSRCGVTGSTYHYSRVRWLRGTYISRGSMLC